MLPTKVNFILINCAVLKNIFYKTVQKRFYQLTKNIFKCVAGLGAFEKKGFLRC